MSDFVWTMRNWRRMCKAQENNGAVAGHECDYCPLDGYGYNCSAIYEDETDDVDFSRVEAVVKKWVEEHPEPQYPTWYEWLLKVGVLEDIKGVLERIKMQLEIGGIKVYAMPSMKIMDPIPDDIAKMLKLSRKEA